MAREGRFAYAVTPHALQVLARPSVLLERLPLIAEAGWITTPSRYLEVLKPEGAHRGFAHHRWGVDSVDGALVLAPKTPLIEHLTFPGETVWEQAPRQFELQVGWRGGLRFEVLGGEGALPGREQALALMGHFFEGVAPGADLGAQRPRRCPKRPGSTSPSSWLRRSPPRAIRVRACIRWGG